MLIKVFGAAVQGIDATLITIEVNSSRGCMFYLVGLPDSAVKESHQRIISALQVNGYRMPTSNIVINMAPADIRKRVPLMTYHWLSACWAPVKLSNRIKQTVI